MLRTSGGAGFRDHQRLRDGSEYDKLYAAALCRSKADWLVGISYAVCAYYGIATGDNSFGYIASWSKDKTLSVSDIVVLRQNGAVSSYYVDSVGFTVVPAFLPENYLKNAEMTIEDDYGMIDGIINNGSKEQPEFKHKAPDLAAMFEAVRQVAQDEKSAPERSKKPSVLAMLHAPAPSRSEKSAICLQTKSAERDLI